MPDFWQFPTVSMGLGPMMAIYQARFMRYMENRGLVPPSDRKVWAFLGDGEMDEPESMGALTMPVREKLDNLVFVINCNLQRLDGPVRGNGKIIQELEAAFLGAGWNVIKVLWGSRWDPLLARDTSGLLRRVMEECVDGEYQNFKAKGGAYTREHFFGKYPELKAMVANMSDEDIWRLNRGGHDARKVYAAYCGGRQPQGPAHGDPREDRQGLRPRQGRRGPDGRAPAEEARRRSAAARSAIASTSRSRTRTSPSCRSASRPRTAEEMRVSARTAQRARRLSAGAQRTGAAAGRSRRSRRSSRCSMAPAIARSPPPWPSCASSRCCSRTRTSARTSCRSCRTRRAPSAWKACSARSASIPRSGQLYTPQDAETLMSYREDKKGQMLEEGINEAGSTCARGSPPAPPTPTTASTWCRSTSTTRCSASSASATSSGRRATSRRAASCSAPRPAARRSRARACSTRTATASCVATTVPNCVAYDPAYAYELAVIIHDGLRRMYVEQQSVFYYITVMNENYAAAGDAGGRARRASSRACTCCRSAGAARCARRCSAPARSCASASRRPQMLEKDYRRAGRVFSVTSFSELRREALECERWNLLHPAETPRVPYVQQLLARIARARSSRPPTTCAPCPIRSASGSGAAT